MNDHNSNFVQYQIIDQQMQGFPVGVFAYPNGWQAGSNVFWNYQNSNSPVSMNAWAINPQKFEMFAFLPQQSFSWTEPDMGMYFRGQNVGGLINLPPMSPEDAVQYWIIPNYCGNKENFKLVGIKVEPITNRPIDQRFQSVVYQQILVRVEYTENGLHVEEEYHAVHQVAQFPPMPGMFGAIQMTGWTLLEFCSFRTEKGKFAESYETFMKIKSSFQVNPQWGQAIQQVAQQIIQGNKQQGDALINQGWQNLQMNQQRMNETAARNQNYINQQQARIDAMPTIPPPSSDFNSGYKNSEYSSSDAFVDAMREEHSIYNSENTANEKVSIHGGDYIWKNERGDIQTTNNPNYDPNIGSNWNWVEAQKKKIGD